jgi:hypothetical protein
MKYKVIQRKNPQDPKAECLFYANAVNDGKFSLRDFAKEIHALIFGQNLADSKNRSTFRS